IEANKNNIDNKHESAPVEQPGIANDTGQKSTEKLNEQKIRAKISAISKFVPIDQSQIERLREKFTLENDPNNTSAESLEAIIGQENANFYKEQRKKAFDRATQIAIEKEVLYVARRLALD